MNETYTRMEEEDIVAVSYEVLCLKYLNISKILLSPPGRRVAQTLLRLWWGQHLDDDLHCPLLWIRPQEGGVLLQVGNVATRWRTFHQY